jgi:hypothetical protein
MIWRNFVIAVWISILWSAYHLGWLVTHQRAVNSFYGPFTMRVVFFPIVVGGAQLLLWLRVYRDRDVRARFAAGIAAGFFMLQVVIQALQASVQIRVSGFDMALFAYLAISHALFAYAPYGRAAR